MSDRFERLVATVGDTLHNGCAVPKGAKIVAACSGGADSVALVALLAAQTSVELVGVAHVEHGLRDAALEAQSAVAAAERAGVPCELLRLALEQGPNLQARARAARYEALEGAVPADVLIATGHTLTDQAETVIQRIFRGAGVRGLQGVHGRRGRLVRPMLGISRDEVRELELPFVEDPTNASGAYQRNRIRRTLLEHLRIEAPHVETSLALVAAQAAGERALLEASLERSGLGLPDVIPLGRGATEAWVRINWPDGTPASRAAVSSIAAAALNGRDFGPIRLSGAEVVSLRDGALVFEDVADSRMRVVAPATGAYRLLNHRLLITEGGGEQHRERPLHVTFLDSSQLIWPIIAHQRTVPRGPRSSRHSGYEFHLTDGAGHVLWDSTWSEEFGKAGRDLHIALFVC